MKIKRLIYFAYYIKKLNKPLFKKFLYYTKEKTGKSSLSIYLDIFKNSMKYNISILEYFQFHFFEIDKKEKSTWAGTGFMYEYQKFMNPNPQRQLLINKAKFLNYNKNFIKHGWYYVENGDFEGLRTFLQDVNGKVVLKNVSGQCGIGVQVVDSSKNNIDEIIALAKTNQLCMAEEFLYQHHDLMKLSPSALNTVRIFTQVVDDDVVILGSRLRISINSNVDNLAAGNMAAYIDSETGIITRPAIFSDITKHPMDIHPVTGVNIIGFKIPNWEQVISSVKKIAFHNKQNRSVGWDIAITENGIDYIEGNHDWCKLVYQLPAGKGLKNELEKYL